MLVGSRDSHWHNFSLSLLLEEGLHHFEQECFSAAGCVGDFGIHLHLAAQVNLVADHVVRSMHAGGRAGHAKRKIGKGGGSSQQVDLAFQIGEDVSGST
jgi:hypothetical protein